MRYWDRDTHSVIDTNTIDAKISVNYGYKIMRPGDMVRVETYYEMQDRALQRQYGVSKASIERWKASRYAACGCRKVETNREFGWSRWDHSGCSA